MQRSWVGGKKPCERNDDQLCPDSGERDIFLLASTTTALFRGSGKPQSLHCSAPVVIGVVECIEWLRLSNPRIPSFCVELMLLTWTSLDHVSFFFFLFFFLTFTLLSGTLLFSRRWLRMRPCGRLTSWNSSQHSWVDVSSMRLGNGSLLRPKGSLPVNHLDACSFCRRLQPFFGQANRKRCTEKHREAHPPMTWPSFRRCKLTITERNIPPPHTLV
ncbi:uncharacterized protein IWZ02DRAFT_94073 [Phyllosticta citriasiana]|uniref:uncharacterized protein n=1 Tax=Phyllosticta citriasiana TaxID=595635 RepID=UPI0030FD3847